MIAEYIAIISVKRLLLDYNREFPYMLHEPVMKRIIENLIDNTKRHTPLEQEFSLCEEDDLIWYCILADIEETLLETGIMSGSRFIKWVGTDSILIETPQQIRSMYATQKNRPNVFIG